MLLGARVRIIFAPNFSGGHHKLLCNWVCEIVDTLSTVVKTSLFPNREVLLSCKNENECRSFDANMINRLPRASRTSQHTPFHTILINQLVLWKSAMIKMQMRSTRVHTINMWGAHTSSYHPLLSHSGCLEASHAGLGLFEFCRSACLGFFFGQAEIAVLIQCTFSWTLHHGPHGSKKSGVRRESWERSWEECVKLGAFW